MKKTLLTILLFVFTVFLSSCASKQDISGFYDIEGMNSVYEFTSDGRIIENGSDTVVSKYRIEGDEIVTYIDGLPESELRFPFKKNGDNFFMGKTEYRRINDKLPQKEEIGE